MWAWMIRRLHSSSSTKSPTYSFTNWPWEHARSVTRSFTNWPWEHVNTLVNMLVHTGPVHTLTHPFTNWPCEHVTHPFTNQPWRTRKLTCSPKSILRKFDTDTAWCLDTAISIPSDPSLNRTQGGYIRRRHPHTHLSDVDERVQPSAPPLDPDHVPPPRGTSIRPLHPPV